jgi:hypothetical protein
MSNHISDELPRLLTGEATRDVVRAAAAHLRQCEDCQQELVSAVVAHASLTSAQRFAPEVVARAAEDPTHTAESEQALPDLTSMFAQVREEAAARRSAPSRRRFRITAVAAVAAGVLIGGGAVALVHDQGSSSSPGRSIALSAFDAGHTSATATVTSAGHMKVNAATLPKLDAQHRYEVWLTNPQRTSMKPIGWLGDNGDAELTVPGNLMTTYSDIEVSVQKVNAPSYDYSGTSVLRGSYSA